MVPTKYVHGQWNVICDRCGRKFKSGQVRKEWTGLRVCTGPGTSDCWEPKHPQLSLKGIPDNMAVPWVRPVATSVEVELTIDPLADVENVIPSSTFNITDPIGS